MVSFFTLFIVLSVLNIALLLVSILSAKGISFFSKSAAEMNTKSRVLALDSSESELKEAI